MFLTSILKISLAKEDVLVVRSKPFTLHIYDLHLRKSDCVVVVNFVVHRKHVYTCIGHYNLLLIQTYKFDIFQGCYLELWRILDNYKSIVIIIISVILLLQVNQGPVVQN